MKKYLLIFLALFLMAQVADARKIRTFLWYTTFVSPNDGPFVETYLSIDAGSIVYAKLDDGRFQGKIEVTMVFKQDDKVINFSKYDLESPIVEDTANIELNFIDQQRFLLPNGSYDFEISMKDLNSDGKEYSYVQPLNISFPDDEICFSGIELVDNYKKSDSNNILTKSGYDLVPYVSNFYPENIKFLTFYTEVYNTKDVLGDDGMFLLKYYIESFETGSPISGLQQSERETAADVVPLLAMFDIAKLPSGNYKLIIEARDRQNKVITSNEVFFQRSNPNIQFDVNDIAAIDVAGSFASGLTDEDTIREYIKSTAPIASEIEKQFIIRQLETTDVKLMQQFFLNFWMKRDNADPAAAWYDYKKEVAKVNHDYSTQVKKGYDTDRGRVYLKYGPPNIITESYDEPSAYPYEIWHYYTLGESQRNKKFVFYAYDLVTNDFQLLHSDAIGELSNYRWQVDLHRRDYDPNNLDVTSPPDSWGSHADKYFRNPF